MADPTALNFMLCALTGLYAPTGMQNPDLARSAFASLLSVEGFAFFPSTAFLLEESAV